MRMYSIIIALLSLFLAQHSFAMTAGDDDNKHCSTIAEACKNAGFTSEGMDDKSFWFGCMKPVLLGKAVNGVKIDAADVKDCRKAKIESIKKTLKEFESVK